MPAPNGLWIAIGDIHDQTGKFAKIPELSQASGIIITGDLTNCGDKKDAENVLAAISASGLPVFAQIGNMDPLPLNAWLSEKGVNIHAGVRELNADVAIAGIGGSVPTPMNTPTEFTEDEYRAWLKPEWEALRKYPHKILISHNPPRDTVCDDLGNGMHVGSVAVREFIEEHQPDACICGHIHEGVGMDKIGKAMVINPGQFGEGGYVVIRYQDGDLGFELKRVED